MTSPQIYKCLQSGFAAAMIVWAVAYGYANYQGNQCTQTFKTLSESNQARIKNVQARIDKIRTREERLQSR